MEVTKMNDSEDNDLIEDVIGTFIDIDPEDVFDDAREAGIEVSGIKDFRKKEDQHERIEELMHDYVDSTANSSAFTGITTGLGGLATAIMLGSLDLASVAIKLYRLSQRLAVLNGFDPREALHKNKSHEIYLSTLGFNAATQAVLRQQLMRATTIAAKEGASGNALLKLIVKIAEMLGKKISYKNAGRLVPIFGGAAGAWINYSFAQKAGNKMIEAYKKAHSETWE